MKTTSKIKKPDQCSIATLEKVCKRYATPRNTQEVFILHAAEAELEKRGTEHRRLRGLKTREEQKREDLKDEIEVLKKEIKTLEQARDEMGGDE